MNRLTLKYAFFQLKTFYFNRSLTGQILLLPTQERCLELNLRVMVLLRAAMVVELEVGNAVLVATDVSPVLLLLLLVPLFLLPQLLPRLVFPEQSLAVQLVGVCFERCTDTPASKEPP